ncbi:MAG: SAM-dependent methyltransferase [Deltaproteobacteria bacterium]|nr:SAM-dependent methyltransferase [Deltaproteobacteria bacterium]
MSLIREIIRREIEKEGVISFERFMELALYFPGYGYYMSNRLPWGKEGDYYTAPQLHKIFGIMAGIQLKEFWEVMGKPKRFTVIEGGPGDGSLARSVLSYLSEYEKDLFRSLCYVLLEKNPFFQILQKDKLNQFENVIWSEDLRDIPLFCGVFISNELFDSFPVRRVKMEEDLKEIYVTFKEGDFVEFLENASSDLKTYIDRFTEGLPKGFITEVCLKLKEFLDELSVKLEEGFIFTVDYGFTSKEYYSKERSGGTLVCYFKHRFHDNPYINVGEQDITAHVNFSALHIWGEERDFQTVGFCPLAPYLVSLGIDRVIEAMKRYIEPPDIFKLKMLLIPEGFGETHRVMIQKKNLGDVNLEGFKLKNIKHSL